jgi:hypothetical protein
MLSVGRQNTVKIGSTATLPKSVFFMSLSYPPPSSYIVVTSDANRILIFADCVLRLGDDDEEDDKMCANLRIMSLYGCVIPEAPERLYLVSGALIVVYPRSGGCYVYRGRDGIEELQFRLRSYVKHGIRYVAYLLDRHRPGWARRAVQDALRARCFS